MGLIVAGDTGGTFTDYVFVNEQGETVSNKVPSTPQDFSLGVMKGVEGLAKLVNRPTSELLQNTSIFGHGSTVAINALLTRRGSKTGLITTKGFEDTLGIGRIHQKVAGLNEDEIINVAELDKADPIVPRSLIQGVTERVDYKGEIVVPLDRAETEKALRRLAAEGVEAIAVVFLWSFMNPLHELAVKKMIRELYPDMFVSVSCELAPVIKEYERTATTCINANLGKVTFNYISVLDKKLKDSGLQTPLMVMQALGGFMSAAEACQKPIAQLSSGPVGGVIGAKILGGAMGYKNIITSDVGGTSFDVGLVVRGETEFAAAPVFVQHSISAPMVDIVSIGAGGGSIAWLEPGTGLLKVGPQSAGAEPGPACYDLGGVEPTVTDADLILNRYDPDFFLGGKMKINRETSLAVMRERIAQPLQMEVAAAAMGVVDIVDAQMADLLRKVTIGRGYDPRDFVLFAFGGAGPSHVGAYGLDVGVKYAVVPYFASVFSAFGIANSDVVHIKETSDPKTFPLDTKRLNAIYEKLLQDVQNEFARDEIAEGNIVMTRTMDVRYRGQVHEVRTPVPAKELQPNDMELIIREFEKAYEDKYGRGTAYRAAGIEAVTYRISAVGKIPKPTLNRYVLETADPARALKGTREVYFKEYSGFHPTSVYNRDLLKAGNVVEGPAVIEASDTTALIHPGQIARIDEYMNIIIELF